MLHSLFAHRKEQAILWCSLCLAIFLTCFPSCFLIQTDYRMDIRNSSSTLQSGTTHRIRPYMDFLNERMFQGQNPFLLTRSEASHRIPLRLPVPHIWISFALFSLAGLSILYWRRIYSRNRAECTSSYIIRYIHDQDGETYRSFLFCT